MSDANRRAHAAERTVCRTFRGTIQPPADEPLPKALVRRLAKERVAELQAKLAGG